MVCLMQQMSSRMFPLVLDGEKFLYIYCISKSVQARWEIFNDHSPDPKQAAVCHGSNPVRTIVAKLVSAAWSKVHQQDFQEGRQQMGHNGAIGLV